jgi:hypothetical protein
MITILAQVGIVQSSLPGRPDHHSLHVLLFVLTVGTVIRWTSEPFSRRTSLALGILLGTGLWVGTEFLVPLALVFAFGLFLWVRGEGSALEKNLWFSLGLLALTVAALVLEHPPSDLFAVEYDRISLPHVFVAVLALTFWAAMSGWERGSREKRTGTGRAVAATLGGIAAIVALAGAFPAFLQGPEVLIDERLTPLWRSFVAEDQPLVGSLSLDGIGTFIAFLGPSLFCLPFLAWRWLREEDRGIRFVWLFLGIGLLAFTALAVSKLRFVAYPEAILALVSGTIIVRLLDVTESIQGRFARITLRTGSAFGIVCGSLFLGFGLISASPQTGAREQAMGVGGCPITEMAEDLSLGGFPVEHPSTIATHMGFGPEILYRTDHSVLGTPYHRNSEGILGLFGILSATDSDRARQLASARGVGLILICPANSWIYSGDSGEGDPSLHQRLSEGDAPAWLEEIPLRTERHGAFRLFRVGEEE